MRRNIRHGDIIKFADEPKGRCWVVLNITKKMIEILDLNIASPGLYAFGGMWFGDKKDSCNSYGKVVNPFLNDGVKLFLWGHISKTPLNRLKKITG